MKTCGKTYLIGGEFKTKCQRPKAHRGDHGPFHHRLEDQFRARLRASDPITFTVPEQHVCRNGFVIGRSRMGDGKVSVQLVGDPFPVDLRSEHLTKGHEQQMAKTPDKKELRKQARTLGVEGWKDMSEKELAVAIKKSKGEVGKTTKAPTGKTKNDKGKPVKPSDKKAAKAKVEKPKKPAKAKKVAPAKKEKTKVAVSAENGNPFRPGSNAAIFADLIIKGGARSKLIEQAKKKIDLKPWAKKASKLDVDFELDKRMLMVVHQLEDLHGFTVCLMGRGRQNGSIKTFAPGVKVPSEALAKRTVTAKPGTRNVVTKPKAAKKVPAKKAGNKPAAAKKTTTTKAKAKKKSKSKK